LILIYLSTAVGLTPGGSTHLHINNTQNITIDNKTTRITKTTQITNLEECWPCPVFVNYTVAFALQLREKHGKTSGSTGKPQEARKNLRKHGKPQKARKNPRKHGKTSGSTEKP
jgi:hypothetical protein